MKSYPTIVAMDLEGVLIPEIWIALAEKIGIDNLRLTTRDISDYDQLMNMRLKILSENKITLQNIQAIIQTLHPLSGAVDFVEWLKQRAQVIILSDTYYEFAKPLIAKLGYPTLFCHQLTVDENGMISGYRLRIKDSKRQAVKSFHQLGFRVIAVGDSYNDTTMLIEADKGILFKPPPNVIAEFPQFPALFDYQDLKKELETYL